MCYGRGSAASGRGRRGPGKVHPPRAASRHVGLRERPHISNAPRATGTLQGRRGRVSPASKFRGRERLRPRGRDRGFMQSPSASAGPRRRAAVARRRRRRLGGRRGARPARDNAGGRRGRRHVPRGPRGPPARGPAARAAVGGDAGRRVALRGDHGGRRLHRVAAHDAARRRDGRRRRARLDAPRVRRPGPGERRERPDGRDRRLRVARPERHQRRVRRGRVAALGRLHGALPRGRHRRLRPPAGQGADRVPRGRDARRLPEHLLVELAAHPAAHPAARRVRHRARVLGHGAPRPRQGRGRGRGRVGARLRLEAVDQDRRLSARRAGDAVEVLRAQRAFVLRIDDGVRRPVRRGERSGERRAGFRRLPRRGPLGPRSHQRPGGALRRIGQDRAPPSPIERLLDTAPAALGDRRGSVQHHQGFG
mmetsp:Transcript_1742/g.5247  ORF Transcript_1742/g.5247 Transcript_1742/m.5247 type:complete len:423 (-) Transcript_1742:59-1327(-)